MSAITAPAPKPAAPTLDIRAISERYISTYATCDIEAIKALHTPDSQFWLHSGGEPVIGRDAIGQAFAGVFQQWPRSGFETYRLIFSDRHWILDWAMTAVLKNPDGSDRPVRFDALDVVEVDETGLVTRKDTFVDSAQVRSALAPAG